MRGKKTMSILPFLILGLCAVILLANALWPESKPRETLFEQMARSPATRMEARRNNEIASCVLWGDSALNTLFASFDPELTQSGHTVDTAQWLFRITYYIDEVSINVPEIVCLVGADWVQIGNQLYCYQSQEDAAPLLSFLDAFFRSSAETYGEEAGLGHHRACRLQEAPLRASVPRRAGVVAPYN